MNWNLISNIASISTLILFVIYFIGRIWNIIQSKNEIKEKLGREDSPDFKIIDARYIGDDNSEILYFTAGESLLSVKIFECTLTPDGERVKKGKLYTDIGPLQNGLTIQFHTHLPEGFPMYTLEYTCNDFMRGTLPFVENSYNQILEQFMYKEHTFKSILYYLFK